jgi:hypothetical protein
VQQAREQQALRKQHQRQLLAQKQQQHWAIPALLVQVAAAQSGCSSSWTGQTALAACAHAAAAAALVAWAVSMERLLQRLLLEMHAVRYQLQPSLLPQAALKI